MPDFTYKAIADNGKIIEDVIEAANLGIVVDKLNKQGYKMMMAPYQTFNKKYNTLQKTLIWKKAKLLLLEYSLINNINLYCPICYGMIYSNDNVMHHKEYKPNELFTPDFIQFVHHRCHSRTHMKY